MANGNAPAPRRQYHVHATFVLYCGVTLLIAVGAFNSNNNLLYWLFGLSLGSMLVSGVISGMMMMALRVEREAIEPAQAGGPLIVRYRVTNRARLIPAFALTIREELDTSQSPGDIQEAAGELADPPEAFASHIPPRTTVTVEGVALASRRGRVRFKGVRVNSAFPFGIIRKSLYFASPASAIVRPFPAPVSADAVTSKRGSGSSGSDLARRHGIGDEFVSLRPYQPGDPPKTIAWKASARGSSGDDLLVRQTGSAAPRRVWIELAVDDRSAPEARERAIGLAAGAIDAARRADMHIGLLAPAWSLACPPRAGTWHIGSLLNDLGLLGPPPESAINAPGTAVRHGDVHVFIGDDGVRGTAPKRPESLEAAI
ncbi:MAG: DUF58 domain-containing protein [Phycisphaerales bacterium]